MATLPFYFGAAAGWCKSTYHVRDLIKIPLISDIIFGSATVPVREGNRGMNFVVLPDGTSTNAKGLNNGGIGYLKAKGREMVQTAHDAGKKFGVSGAWFTAEEAGQLAETACAIGADFFERNDGCPNVFDEGKQKAIPSYAIDLMAEADEYVVRAVGTNIVLRRKLSPYVNPEERVLVAKYLSNTNTQALVTSNTLPNVRLRGDDGQPLITAENTNGLGGMGGTQLKQLALANAEHFRELLPETIKVIGVGGIRSSRDVQDYLQIGCVGVQVGTACFYNDQIQVLQEIADEWLDQYAAA